MCIAMCGIGFPVWCASCNVLCGASCRPGICKKTIICSFRINCFMNSRPKDINNNSTTIICCMFVAMCGVKAVGKTLRALGKLWEFWESSGNFVRTLGELWERSGGSLGALGELWGSSGEV